MFVGVRVCEREDVRVRVWVWVWTEAGVMLGQRGVRSLEQPLPHHKAQLDHLCKAQLDHLCGRRLRWKSRHSSTTFL